MKAMRDKRRSILNERGSSQFYLTFGVKPELKIIKKNKLKFKKRKRPYESNSKISKHMDYKIAMC
jgi:hypothetical protein